MEALENKTPLLGIVDVQSELSESLTKILENYCKERAN
jgi:hypothetical protein